MAGSPTVSSRTVASSHRAVPLRSRPDLVVAPISYRGVVSPVIKDPLALKYFRLQPEQAAVLQLLDGRRSIEQIRDELQREHPTIPVTRADVQHLVADLHEKGLLISERPGQAVGLLQGRRKRKAKSLFSSLSNPLYIRLPGWDPDRLLTWLNPLVGWLLKPWAVIPTLLLVAFAYLFVAVRFQDMQQRLPEFNQFFGWPNLLYLYLTLAIVKVLHEFGHGIACKHFGAECHSMGLMLLVFSPTLYCDASDSWLIRNKWKRIFIGAAGMYVEVILASIAVFLWWGTQPGLINHLCLNLFFVSTVTTVIFNANPLMRFDGYFMLADFLEIPNLRPKADRMLREALGKICFGIEPRHDPFMPTSGRGWFIQYAVSAFCYRWFVTWAIILFLYTALKPYRLQSVGIAMAMLSISTMLFQMGRSLYQMLSAPRTEPLSRVRVAFSLGLIAALVLGGLFVPIPWYLEAPLTIQPVGVQHIYNAVPGRLEAQLVAEGDRVAQGAAVVSLANRQLLDRVTRLRAEREAQSLDVTLYREQGRRDDQLVAEKRQATLAQQEAELLEELRLLEIVAPVGGVVIAAPWQQRQSDDTSGERLSSWSGTPLTAQNAGTWLAPRTHICSIAPHPEYEAILLIDQADRSEAEIGREVSFKLELLPDVTLTGSITAISDRYVDVAPPSLSNKFGGPLATTSGATGEERLVSVAYQAMVPLEGVDPQLLRTGMRGSARLMVGKRSAAEWIWRSLRNTFKFRL